MAPAVRKHPEARPKPTKEVAAMTNDTSSHDVVRDEQDAHILDKLIVDAVAEDQHFRFSAWSPAARHDLSQRQKAEILAALPDAYRLRNPRAYAGVPVERLVKLAWLAETIILSAANVNKGYKRVAT